jgi:predicted nucleotidyltransferase
MESKSSDNNIAIKYHNIFNYKLTKEEAVKWQYKNYKVEVSGIKNKKRIENEKYSKKKLQIAKNATKILEKIPTVLFVGVTGSLAMMNASKNSDVDLMVITKSDRLWITRFVVYFLLVTNHYTLRRPLSDNEKDKLCLNMWLDEISLVWDKKDRNIYTAHEVLQVVPLINKNNTYEKFIYKNKWALSYWPNAVKIKQYDLKNTKLVEYNIMHVFEKIAFRLQYLYMKNKITNEIVTLHKAIFHPNDWGKVILNRLNK